MLENNSQQINLDSKKTLQTLSFENVCRAQAPSDKPIKRIISIHALPMIVSSEKTGDSISFSGNTSYQIVYQTEEDKLTSFICDCDWQNSVLVTSLGEYFIDVNVKDNFVTDSSLTEVVISTVLNIDVDCIVTETVNLETSFPEEYIVKENNHNYNKVINTIKENFNVVQEHEFDGQIDEILYSNAFVNNTNAIINIDLVSFEGEIVVNSYCSKDGLVFQVDKIINFKQEVSALSVVNEHLIDSNVKINKLKVSNSVNEIDNKTNLIYSIDLEINGVVYSIETNAFVEDVFSTKKEITLSSECLLNETYFGQFSIEDVFNSVCELETNVTEILYFMPTAINVNTINKEDNLLKIDGVIDLKFVCLTEGNMPIELKSQVPFFKEFNDINSDKVKIEAKIVSYKLKNERELDVNLQLNYHFKEVKEDYVTFVSNIEELEDKEIIDEAIVVYVVKKGETLFDVAKKLNISPEDIKEQNELENEELEEGLRLTLYIPIDAKF